MDWNLSGFGEIAGFWKLASAAHTHVAQCERLIINIK